MKTPTEQMQDILKALETNQNSNYYKSANLFRELNSILRNQSDGVMKGILNEVNGKGRNLLFYITDNMCQANKSNVVMPNSKIIMDSQMKLISTGQKDVNNDTPLSYAIRYNHGATTLGALSSRSTIAEVNTRVVESDNGQEYNQFQQPLHCEIPILHLATTRIGGDMQANKALFEQLVHKASDETIQYHHPEHGTFVHMLFKNANTAKLYPSFYELNKEIAHNLIQVHYGQNPLHTLVLSESVKKELKVQDYTNILTAVAKYEGVQNEYGVMTTPFNQMDGNNETPLFVAKGHTAFLQAASQLNIQSACQADQVDLLTLKDVEKTKQMKDMTKKIEDLVAKVEHLETVAKAPVWNYFSSLVCPKRAAASSIDVLPNGGFAANDDTAAVAQGDEQTQLLGGSQDAQEPEQEATIQG